MKIKITGKELKITEAINDYVEKKLERIDKYFEEAVAEVTLKTEKQEQIAEIYVQANGEKYTINSKYLRSVYDKYTKKKEKEDKNEENSEKNRN